MTSVTLTVDDTPVVVGVAELVVPVSVVGVVPVAVEVAGAPGPPGPEGPASTVPGPAGPPGPSIIVQPELPDPTGLPEGVMWVDEDSDVAAGGGLDQATADGLYVNIDGDTMTGSLTISAPWAAVGFDRPDPGSGVGFVWASQGQRRWAMRMGTGEPGGNAGSAWEVERYDDSGNVIDIPFTVYRNDGFTSINGLYCGYASFDGAVMLTGDPSQPLQAAPKQYVDARTPPILVLGPTDPVPGGTPAGTVIIRKAT